MQHIHDLIAQHGNFFYLFTFLWTVLEGETFVIFAGLAAQRGLLNIWLLFLAAWLGSFCGDQIAFAVGRLFGTRILNHLPRLKPGVEKALKWLERYAVAFILSYRFMYGIRNVSSIAVGLSHLSWRKFAFWNCVAAFGWAAVFAGFGYLFGDVFAHIKHKEEVVSGSVRDLTIAALGLFVLVVAVKFLMIRWYQKHDRRRRPRH